MRQLPLSILLLLSGFSPFLDASAKPKVEGGEGFLNELSDIQALVLPSALKICFEYNGRESEKCGWRFNVVETNEINAYAHGSNQVTVLSGLMDQWVNSQDELAFVIAHELAHHIADHVQSTRKRVTIGSLVGVVGGIAASNRVESEDEKLEVFSESVGVAAQVGYLIYNKEQEAEADLIALRILNGTNYDLKKARQLLLRMRESNPAASSFLDTHPSGAERLISFDEVMSRLPHRPQVEITRVPNGFEIGSFEYIAGSYCVYTTTSGKRPVPKVEGCPSEKLFSKD